MINYQSNIKYILSASLVLFAISLWGQRNVPKYDNIIKELASSSNENAFNLLNDYRDLAGEKAGTNVSFLLAEKGYEILKEIDPILNYADFKKFAKLTADFYKQTSENLNESDVKRDRDYFFNVPISDKKINIQDVQEYIDRKKEGLEQFVKGSTNVHNSFSDFYRNYIQAFDIYKKISETYTNESDFYAEKISLSSEYLKQIESAFDSALYYAEQYKDALIDSPTKGYVANFTYKTLADYRQDGLTKIDFTNGALWNYGEWAKAKRQILINKVNPVNIEAKKDLDELNKRIESYPNIKGEYKVAPETYKNLFLINASNPLINNLKQKTAQLNFLIADLNPLNKDTYDPKNDKIEEKVDFYYDLVKKYLEYRKLSELIEESSTNQDSTNFNISIFAKLEQALGNFKSNVVATENYYRSSLKLKYKKEEIPLYYTTGFYRPTSAGYITKAIVPIHEGYYLSGSSISPQGFAMAFVAYSADGQNITWFKPIDIGKIMYDDCAVALTLTTDNACAALITSKNVSDPSIRTQTIISYNIKGEEKSRITLPEKTLPIGRFISYNSEKETFLLGFYGETEDWYQVDGKLIIQQIDKQNMMLMRSEVELNGELTSVMEFENNFLVVGHAYDLITSEEKHESKVCNSFSLSIDKKGVVASTNIYSNEKSYYCIKAFEAKNNTMILLGEEGKPRKNMAAPLENKKGVEFIMIDNDGSMLNSNNREKLWIYKKNVSESM